MSLELKIDVRHSNTGNKIRTVTRFTNFTMERKFNSLASTFSFEFYFDPKDKELAEIVCVSHLHVCQIYYNGRLELTGLLLTNEFTNSGKPELVPIGGYSTPGILNKCDIPFSLYPLETDGLTLKQILQKILPPFHIGLVVNPSAKGINKQFVSTEKDVAEKMDENIGKSASESSQNVGAYISELTKQRNIVASHNEKGQLYITTPNTKGTPIFNFDFTSTDPNNDARKIPGVTVRFRFNADALNTEITVVQQADDEEGSNAAQTTIKNPLIPIGPGTLYMPKTVVISSGNQFTVGEAARYELGKQVREAAVWEISMATIEINKFLITPNNTVTLKDPSVYLYNATTLFIQSIYYDVKPNSQTCVLSCVLPFGYDFDASKLKNVWVDPHNNLPRF